MKKINNFMDSLLTLGPNGAAVRMCFLFPLQNASIQRLFFLVRRWFRNLRTVEKKGKKGSSLDDDVFSNPKRSFGKSSEKLTPSED